MQHDALHVAANFFPPYNTIKMRNNLLRDLDTLLQRTTARNIVYDPRTSGCCQRGGRKVSESATCRDTSRETSPSRTANPPHCRSATASESPPRTCSARPCVSVRSGPVNGQNGTHVFLRLVVDEQAAAALIQHAVEHLVQDHLRQPASALSAPACTNGDKGCTHLASTSCWPCPTCCAT